MLETQTLTLRERVGRIHDLFDQIRAIWMDRGGHLFASIHDLPHELIHELDGREGCNEPPTVYIAAHMRDPGAGTRATTYFGKPDTTCDRCCALLGIENQAAEADKILEQS